MVFCSIYCATQNVDDFGGEGIIGNTLYGAAAFVWLLQMRQNNNNGNFTNCQSELAKSLLSLFLTENTHIMFEPYPL